MIPPLIKPCPSNLARPLWSVMIPTYNCSHLLSQALESVLAQDPGEHLMQIEVVDDASTDADVKNLVERIGGGRVTYFQQARNVGSLKNFETCLNRSKGELVHLLHADDKVRMGYYEKIGSLFQSYPGIGAAFCRYDTIDESGKVLWTHYKEIPEPGILYDYCKARSV